MLNLKNNVLKEWIFNGMEMLLIRQITFPFFGICLEQKWSMFQVFSQSILLSNHTIVLFSFLFSPFFHQFIDTLRILRFDKIFSIANGRFCGGYVIQNLISASQYEVSMVVGGDYYRQIEGKIWPMVIQCERKAITTSFGSELISFS